MRGGRGLTRRYKVPKIKNASEKRRVQSFKYSNFRKRFLRDNSMCKAHIPGICLQVSQQIHHKAGRIGDLLNDRSKWLAVCSPCHHWITEHSREAIELGFSESRLETK